MNTNKDARRIKKEWSGRGFPLTVAEGYTPRFGGLCRYLIYQWNIYGGLYHANFFYQV